MPALDVGDRVRVDIPNKNDPAFDRYHRAHGEITAIIEDDAGTVTGDDRDSRLYRVYLDSGEIEDFRWRALRPTK